MYPIPMINAIGTYYKDWRGVLQFAESAGRIFAWVDERGTDGRLLPNPFSVREVRWLGAGQGFDGVSGWHFMKAGLPASLYFGYEKGSRRA